VLVLAIGSTFTWFISIGRPTADTSKPIVNNRAPYSLLASIYLLSLNKFIHLFMVHILFCFCQTQKLPIFDCVAYYVSQFLLFQCAKSSLTFLQKKLCTCYEVTVAVF